MSLMSKNKVRDEKILEALLYLAQHEENFYIIGCLAYLADKEHLNRYGRTVSTDSYQKSLLGPVPIQMSKLVRTIAKGYHVDGISTEDDLTVELNEFGYIVKPRRLPDLEWLSNADIKCLDSVLLLYNKEYPLDIIEQCQDLAVAKTKIGDAILVDDIIRTLPNAEDLIDYYHNHNCS